MLGREAGYKEFKGWNETREGRVSIVGSNKEDEATNKQVVNATGKGMRSVVTKNTERDLQGSANELMRPL